MKQTNKIFYYDSYRKNLAPDAPLKKKLKRMVGGEKGVDAGSLSSAAPLWSD